MTIEANTVDFSAHVYEDPHELSYRWKITPDPDLPGSVDISYEELAFYDNRTRSAYETNGSISFDKATWEKIKHAVDGVFEKTI